MLHLVVADVRRLKIKATEMLQQEGHLSLLVRAASHTNKLDWILLLLERCLEGNKSLLTSAATSPSSG